MVKCAFWLPGVVRCHLDVGIRMERQAPRTLSKLTAIKDIVSEWNQVNFNNIDHREFVAKELKLEENALKIMAKITLLALPKTVLEDLKRLVRPIGLRILNWIEYHQCFFKKTGHSIQDFVPLIKWTQEGTVDQSATIEVLINSDFLVLEDQFQLACIYCLEGHIRKLWGQLGTHEISRLVSRTQDQLPILVRFWCHRLTGDLDKLPWLDAQDDLWDPRQHPDRHGFALAVGTKNETAVRWFWKKIESELSLEQREDILVQEVVFLAKQRPILIHTPPLNFSNEHCAQILLFLLGQMDEKQVKNLGVKLRSMGGMAELLKYLLDWPYQKCLDKLAKLLGGSLGPEDYSKVLRKIIDKIENVHETDCDYRALFAEFWGKNVTLNSRLDHAHVAELLVRLISIGHFNNRDARNIKSVIRDASQTAMQQLMQEGVSLQKVCFAMVKRGMWSVYETLLGSCQGIETDLDEQKSKVFALVGQTICKDLIVSEKNWALVHEFTKWSNLSTAVKTRLIQDLKAYEADYHEKIRLSKSRKRNTGTNYRTMAKRQSR